jgi:hypothetical protein
MVLTACTSSHPEYYSIAAEQRRAYGLNARQIDKYRRIQDTNPEASKALFNHYAYVDSNRSTQLMIWKRAKDAGHQWAVNYHPYDWKEPSKPGDH